MEKEQRTRLQKATQDARCLLEEEFRSQLLQTYDIDVDKMRWAEEPGAHLLAEQRLIREKLIAWIEHKEAQINDRKEALLLALREMAFTALNRFVALKLMEARELVRPCVSGGLESAGFLEFSAVAQGLLADQESSYRLYLETIFEDVSRELRALFDPRDPASLLWPKRAGLLELLVILNRPELAELWNEDETLGWVYQYFNGNDVKEMRDAVKGGAPRNSRELAVRNQFFTPRYVVEFLTDNTLGRIWYEMCQGKTGLKDRCRYLALRPNEIWLQPGEEATPEVVADEAFSQEDLLAQPFHIHHRPLKDPREIRMLDPACGSMHFGLYAFDLYLEIYTEAWEIAHGQDEQAKQDAHFAPFVAYAVGFANKAAFLHEVPRLILRHNIHGIDIDPRATQIARLTLWLRAQRAWQEQLLGIAVRPAVTRSNVVCAEPMPGERELLADFVDEQFPESERGLVQQLLEAIFDKMLLAGEAGSLLKIEEEIREAIDEARKKWQLLAVRQKDLFSPSELAALGKADNSLNEDLLYLTSDFWMGLEDRIYNALKNYTEQAENNHGFQRRLFAEDAAQGFAFIDVCRKRYDVALMNPPFGLMPQGTYAYLVGTYNNAYSDLALSFMSRGMDFTLSHGLTGAITSRAFLNVSDAEKFRRNIAINHMRLLVDFGNGVMDGAFVDASAQILGNRPVDHVFIKDVREVSDKGVPILSFYQNSVESPSFVFAHSHFQSIPKHRFAYDSAGGLDLILSTANTIDPVLAIARTGASTFEDDRFLRLVWEVSPKDLGPQKTWNWIARTTPDFCQYYYPYEIATRWNGDGAELCERNRQVNGQVAQARQGSTHYFKSGIVFSRRSRPSIAFRIHPRDCVFSSGCGVIFPHENDLTLPLMGILNSRFVRTAIHTLTTYSYTVGHIRAILSPLLSEGVKNELSSLVGRIVQNKIKCFSLIETDHHFLPCQYWGDATSLRGAYANTSNALNLIEKQLREDQLSIDAIVSGVFGISEYLDTSRFKINAENILLPQWLTRPTVHGFIASFLSHCIGFAFGRWNIQCKELIAQGLGFSDPLAPLPVCAPGQLQNAKGLPSQEEDLCELYPLQISWEGIIVDDPDHPHDIENRIIDVLASTQLGGSRLTAIEIIDEACEVLGVSRLRDWFRRPGCFFGDHIKRYSRSRRQAPIYWQLSAGCGSYSVWIYYHRITADTLYQVLGIVKLRLEEVEREISSLGASGAMSDDASSRLQEAQSLLTDLRVLKSELDLIAPLWRPNLNDGVLINHALLWRLTAHNSWQSDCKECWDRLCNGDCDWAHLAFHLWPERVIRACTTDRSLAIAHRLEDRLWQETNNGNWLPRQLTEADLQALIAEHSKPAVKSALERFLAAPPPVAPTRTRASRGTRAGGSSAPRRPRGTAAVVDAEATRQVLLALTAAPSDGLAKAAIADLIGVEANALTAVIKQLKESEQIEQLGAARGARYRLTEAGRSAINEMETD